MASSQIAMSGSFASLMGPPTILVVDDDPSVRNLIIGSLSPLGYRVAGVPDARGAYAFIDEEPVAIIFQSLRLPDARGLDLAARLQARLEGEDTPIVAMSPLSNTLETLARHEDVFADFLVKPFEVARLVELARAYAPISDRLDSTPGRQRRVLLASSGELDLKVLRLRFRRAGYRVLAAADGEEALELAVRERPDAIVADVLVERMDGYRLCHSLRQSGGLGDVPIILLTRGQTEDRELTLSRQAGANRLMARSTDLTPVIAALTELLDFPSSAPEVEPPGASADLTSALFRERLVRSLDRQARFGEELRRVANIQAAQLSVLAGVSDSLTRALDVQTVLTEALVRCLDVSVFSRGAAYLADPVAGFSLVTSHGFQRAQREQLADFFGFEMLLDRVVADAEVLALPSPTHALRRANDLVTAAGCESLLVVPLVAAGQRLGALVMGSQEHDLSQHGFAFARTVQAQLSQSILLVNRTGELARISDDLRLILASLHEGVYRLDPEGRITYVNAAVTAMLGWPEERLVDQDVHVMLHPRWADGAPLPRNSCQVCSDATVSGDPVDTSIRCSDGSFLPVRQSQRPVFNALGKQLGWVVTFRDVTQQRKLEEQLRQAQRLEAFGQLAGGVAHEFNNLLTPILGNLELVLDDRGLANGVRDLVGDARQAAHRASELVAQMTAFGRRAEVFMQPTDVGHLVLEVVRLLRQSVDRSIDLDVQIADNLQLARGDSTLMRQVLLNLGLNARDAIRSARKAGREQAGTIRFEVQERDVLEGELGSSPDAHAGRFVVVSVSDDGCGMSGETLSRVFEPFFTTKAMGAGTGLGLAVVHGILRQHAGWIEVLSALGAGTTFACYLPVTTEAAVASPSSDREPLAAAPGGCVLMVDDDDLVRRTARRLLEDAGYEVREAVDGPSALDRYQGEREEIDVVLLDLSMPGMSGDEVLRELLIMDPLARVVLWSGYSKSEAASSLAETGARAFLSKPFDARGLLGVIARVIEE